MSSRQYFKLLALTFPVLLITACAGPKNSSVSTTGQSNEQTSETTNTTTNPNVNPQVAPMEKPIDLSTLSPLELTARLSEAELKNMAIKEVNVIYFEYDSSKIASNYRRSLEIHAAYLNKNAAINIVVEGHADERGTPEYNIALGERRANAVVSYLQSLGVQARQISLVSYGEEKPVRLGQIESDYAQNRRGVIVYR